MAYSNIANNSIISSEKLHYMAKEFLDVFMVVGQLLDTSKDYKQDDNITTVKIFCQSFEDRINSIVAEDLKAIIKHSQSFKVLKSFIYNESLNDKKTFLNKNAIEDLQPLMQNFCLYLKRAIHLYFLPYELLEPLDNVKPTSRDKSSKPLGNIINYNKTLQSIFQKNEGNNWIDNNYDSAITADLVYSFYGQYTKEFTKDFLIDLYKYHYVSAFLQAIMMLEQAALLKEKYFNIIADTFRGNGKDNISFGGNPIICANIIIILDENHLINKIDLSEFFNSNFINPVFSASLEALAQANKLDENNFKLIKEKPTLSFHLAYNMDAIVTKNKHSQADLNKLRWFMMITHHNSLLTISLANDLCEIVDVIKYVDGSISIPLSIAVIIINCLELKDIGLCSGVSNNGFISNDSIMQAVVEPKHPFYQNMDPPDIKEKDQEKWIIELKKRTKWRAKIDAHYYCWGLIDNTTISLLKTSIINGISKSNNSDILLEIILKRHEFYNKFTTINKQGQINCMIMEIQLIIKSYAQSPNSFDNKFISNPNFRENCKNIVCPPYRQNNKRKNSDSLSISAESDNSNTNIEDIYDVINRNNYEENQEKLAVEEFINLHKKEQYYFKWSFCFFTISLRKHFCSYWKSNYENVNINEIVNLAVGTYSNPRYCFFGTSNSGSTSRDILKHANVDIDELQTQSKTNEEIKQMVITGLISHRGARQMT